LRPLGGRFWTGVREGWEAGGGVCERLLVPARCAR
jgi:hypothetical protein